MLFINFMAWPKVLPPKSDDDPIPICGGKIYDEKDDDGWCLIFMSAGVPVFLSFRVY